MTLPAMGMKVEGLHTRRKKPAKNVPHNFSYVLRERLDTTRDEDGSQKFDLGHTDQTSHSRYSLHQHARTNPRGTIGGRDHRSPLLCGITWTNAVGTSDLGHV